MRALVLLFLSLFSSVCPAADIPGELVVKYRESPQGSLSINKIQSMRQLFKDAKRHGFQIRSKKAVELPDLSNIYLLKFPKDTDIQQIINSLKTDSNVIYAHPNHLMRALSTIPNDPGFISQWGLNKIKADQAWDITQGSSSLIIAVIDGGVNYIHEDLTGKIILGRDFVNSDDNPMDDEGHGTHVAGIIAALTNNSKGIAGINWNAKILAVKVLDAAGSGSTANVAEGVQYAADNNASIINLSLGDESSDLTLKQAIDYAITKGCLIVAAAGNENTNIPIYPAAYTNVLAVAAADENDKRSVWSSGMASNYGTWVGISAPGTTIYSTFLSNSYSNKHGTSMASPFVAGTASLLIALKPDLTASQIINRLKAKAVNIDSLNPGYAGQLGAGRIDAAAALYPLAQISYPSSQQVINGTFDIKGSARAINFNKYTVKIGSGFSPSSYSTLASNTSQVIENTLASYTSTTTADGAYTIKLLVENTEPETSEASCVFLIDNSPPQADISFPINGAYITDSITIKGTAMDGNLDYYILEYLKDGINYERICSGGTSVSSGDLGTWNTSGLSGDYTLRLSVTDKALNTASKSITLELDNSQVNNKTVTGASCSSPNPFNPSTQSTAYISYNLNNNFNTKLYLFDITGKLIFRRDFQAGELGGKAGQNPVPWNGKNNFGEIVPNGVYFFKVAAENRVISSGKIIVLY